MVRVRLSEARDTLRIEVKDWGAGFDPKHTRAGSFGLESIRERARQFGGRTTVRSAPGKGTKIEVTLPLRPVPAGSEDAPDRLPAAGETGRVSVRV